MAVKQSPSPKSPRLFTEIHHTFSAQRGWHVPPPTISPGADDDIFVAYHRTYPDRSALEKTIWIEVRHPQLLEELKGWFGSCATLYDAKPGIDGRNVYLKRHTILCQRDKKPHVITPMDTLLEFIIQQFQPIEQKLLQLPPNTTLWSLLWCIFPAGSEIATTDEQTDVQMGMILDSWSFATDFKGRAFIAKCHYHQWTGLRFQKIEKTLKISEFNDIQLVSSLPFWPLTAEAKVILEARGRIYRDQVELMPWGGQYAQLTYAQYSGSFHAKSFTSTARISGTGRVMLDMMGYRRCNPTMDLWSDDVNQSPQAIQSSSDATLPDHLLHLLPGTVPGFSFRAKRWGSFLISNLFPISWSPTAFSHLVIPPTYKRVIQALMRVHAGDQAGAVLGDVVEEKGGGLIVALYGPPGTGKTLTAEAMAEHLRRPLFVLSAAELGTNLVQLERKLNETFELVTSWKAVLLIDEADIFLEKRASGDLERNALVGLFLRVLEYFNGVLVLTTNRIDEFDEAFESRFSLALPYHALDFAARRILWGKFLESVPRSDGQSPSAVFDLDYLASHIVNGRTIKQLARTGHALALAVGEDLRMGHLRDVIALRYPSSLSGLSGCLANGLKPETRAV